MLQLFFGDSSPMLVVCDVGVFVFFCPERCCDDAADDPIDAAHKPHAKALAIQNEAVDHTLLREWMADALEQYSFFDQREAAIR